MTAYNPDWLDALLIKDTALDWQQKGLLTDAQGQAIKARYPSNFYSPHVFVRIGLAIFCFILLMAAIGVLALLINLNSQTGVAVLSIFGGMLCLVLLEQWAIQSARHYGSGIDDVLLYVSLSGMLGGIYLLLPNSADGLTYALMALPFLLAGALRYLDRLLTIAAFVCTLQILFLVINKIPGAALYLLPFTGMAFSAGVYFFVRKGQTRYAWRHWHALLGLAELLALLTFYASGNYWVVQQLGYDLFQLERPPLPWFFWAFTYGVPAAYITLGLWRKDRLLLDIGVGCVIAAIGTFRYYFQVMPLAWAATLAGGVAFLVAFFSIRYLRHHEGAYTYEADGDLTLLQEVEEQLIEQTISAQNPPANQPQEPQFGGGQFGGGGAGQDI